MQQMYWCPRCRIAVRYGQSVCTNCGVILNWAGVSAPAPPYGQQYPNQQQGWDQRQEWNQPPPYNQPPAGGYQNQYYQQDMYGSGATIPKKKSSSGLVISVIAFMFILFIGGVIALTINGNHSTKASSTEPSKLTAPSIPPITETPPAVTSFSVDPPTITSGQTANLSWDVSGATSISINQGIGTISSSETQSGTQVVSPTATTAYTLTATNSAGSVTSSATVTVNPAAVPMIAAFTASPTTINAGESSTLQWDITGATSISIDQGIGTPSSAYGQVVSPTANTTYTLTATNSAGSVTATATVTVNSTDVPVITTFTASPTTINAGESSTLQWDITGATSVSIDQGIGTIPSSETQSGTQVVSPTATTTYTLTATNSAGSVNTSTTITVH